jgi:hypothetical protein
MALEAHSDALDADQYCLDHIIHQHFCLFLSCILINFQKLIDQLEEHRLKDRKNARKQFQFRGQEVCHKQFVLVFVHAIVFIRNYAQQYPLKLAGKYITNNGNAKDLFLFSTVANMTRKYIYDQYLICCRHLRKSASLLHFEALSGIGSALTLWFLTIGIN